MQGVVWSCIACRVQYAMHQSTWKSFGDASEMHWKSAGFDMQCHTLTGRVPLRPLKVKMTHGVGNFHDWHPLTCSLSDDMVVGSRSEEGERV